MGGRRGGHPMYPLKPINWGIYLSAYIHCLMVELGFWGCLWFVENNAMFFPIGACAYTEERCRGVIAPRLGAVPIFSLPITCP
ncbi:MAG: hypothetical protein RLZZ490_364 [Cyanobacteriota bacterium]|jgi:hypothetical protein